MIVLLVLLVSITNFARPSHHDQMQNAIRTEKKPCHSNNSKSFSCIVRSIPLSSSLLLASSCSMARVHPLYKPKNSITNRISQKPGRISFHFPLFQILYIYSSSSSSSSLHTRALTHTHTQTHSVKKTKPEKQIHEIEQKKILFNIRLYESGLIYGLCSCVRVYKTTEFACVYLNKYPF